MKIKNGNKWFISYMVKSLPLPLALPVSAELLFEYQTSNAQLEYALFKTEFMV